MANTPAELPATCPRHGSFAPWVLVAEFGLFYCDFTGADRRCMWPMNQWAPGSDSYAASEAYIVMWKQAWSL